MRAVDMNDLLRRLETGCNGVYPGEVFEDQFYTIFDKIISRIERLESLMRVRNENINSM